MKKILWLLILLPIFMTRVLASEIYYSEYSDFSDYQDEKIEKNDMVNVEETIMYKWYKLVKVPGEFKLYNSTDNFTDNCYETEFSNWTNTKPIINEATTLEEKTIYNYQIIESVRYIHLYDVSGSYDAFRIPELQIFIDDKKIDYTFTCIGCWENFEKYINNGIYIENESYIDNGGSLIIDLGKEYPINKVKILFYVFDMGDSDKKYTLGYSKDGKDIFINKSYNYQFSSSYIKDAKKFEYTITNLDIANNLWLKSKTSEQYLDNEYVYSRTSYRQYRYNQKFCETYALNKEYHPKYSIKSISDYNLKDSEKIFYRYQIRDKLELNIYDITEKNYDLNNFVIYSSDKYSIESDIDWNKNGVYNVIFNLNDINVSKNVNINILSNALEEKEEKINDLKNQLESTINDYEKIIQSLEKTNQEYLNSLNDLNIQIIEQSKKIENLKNENIVQKELIETIQNELNSKFQEYGEKISNLEKLNQKYLENLNVLSNNIYTLESRIDILDSNQQDINLEVDNLKEQIQKYIEEYDKKIKYLQDYNNDYILKLEEVNSNIENINNSLIELRINGDDRYNELKKMIEENAISINSVKNVIDNNLDEFKKINSEIDKIKKQLQHTESNNKHMYDNLTSELENTEQDIKEKIDNLNLQIQKMELEISNLNNTNEIQNDKIGSLQTKLEENIQIYETEIQSLNDFNTSYLNKLDNLANNIKELEEQLENIKDKENSNRNDIENLDAEIVKYKEQYNNIITYLGNFNQSYLEDLKTIGNKFKILLDRIQQTKVINDEKFEELNSKINQNSILLKKFENDENEKYEEILNNQNNINNNINNYQNVISNLKELNDKYILEISLLKEEIRMLSIEIEDIKNSKEYEVIENYQKLIYDKIIENNEEILEIKQNQINDNQNIEKLKENILYVSRKVDQNEEEKDNSLNSKLNDYVLKINGIEVVNLLWIYVVVTILFGIYLEKSRTKR